MKDIDRFYLFVVHNFIMAREICSPNFNKIAHILTDIRTKIIELVIWDLAEDLNQYF